MRPEPACSSATSRHAAPPKMNIVRKSGDTVLAFDGIYANMMSTNANRINARHIKNKYANFLYYDGHVQSWPVADLPGGITAATSDFNMSNLNQARYALPVWRLEQQSQ